MKFLIEGERLIKRFSQSRMVQYKLYFGAVILFLVPVFYNYYKVQLPVPDLYVMIAPAAIGIILILMAELKTRLGNYYITNYRIVSSRGALKKTIDSCTYDKIVNVKVMQSFVQRIFGMGTIDITTYQRTEILLSSISNPSEIERLIYGAMEKLAGQQPSKPERQGTQQPSQQQSPPQQPPSPPPYQPPPGEQPSEKSRFRSF
jgi:membrane protein YdbS with pleckstrin-like domain